MFEAMQFEFMRNALLAGLLASLACGVIGTLVVVNRQVFMAGGVAHTAYGGVGLAFYLGLPVLPCAVAFTVLAALVMAMASFGRAERLGVCQDLPPLSCHTADLPIAIGK